MQYCTHTYEDITSLENLLGGWEEFVVGKRSRKDVQEFERELMHNVIALHEDLAARTYVHGQYEAFSIADPKPRDIHKATVRDRLLHHAIYRKLYPYFDARFIADSFSCRLGKGTHKALERFRSFAYKASSNHTRTAWVLQCDVRKFFASIDHEMLIDILHGHIANKDILWLLERIIGSFSSACPGVGLPLGNLTSQLLVNIYMNEFDQFIKHELKVKFYARYADDFFVMSHDKSELELLLPKIVHFLRWQLKLELHPKKVTLRTFASGVDFLGWIHFPDHRVLRTATRLRMLRRLEVCNANRAVMNSYKGLLSHGNSRKLLRALDEVLPVQ